MFIYSIYDKKGCFHVNQFFAKNDAEAVRVIGRMANDSRSDLALYPDEFSLFCVGEFNSDNGSISPITPIKFVVEVMSLIKVDKMDN